MRSMPWMLLYEGTFSTVWVQFTSPPHTSFSTMRTERLVRAAYSARRHAAYAAADDQDVAVPVHDADS